MTRTVQDEYSKIVEDGSMYRTDMTDEMRAKDRLVVYQATSKHGMKGWWFNTTRDYCFGPYDSPVEADKMLQVIKKELEFDLERDQPVPEFDQTGLTQAFMDSLDKKLTVEHKITELAVPTRFVLPMPEKHDLDHQNILITKINDKPVHGLFTSDGTWLASTTRGVNAWDYPGVGFCEVQTQLKSDEPTVYVLARVRYASGDMLITASSPDVTSVTVSYNPVLAEVSLPDEDDYEGMDDPEMKSVIEKYNLQRLVPRTPEQIAARTGSMFINATEAMEEDMKEEIQDLLDVMGPVDEDDPETQQ